MSAIDDVRLLTQKLGEYQAWFGDVDIPILAQEFYREIPRDGIETALTLQEAIERALSSMERKNPTEPKRYAKAAFYKIVRADKNERGSRPNGKAKARDDEEDPDIREMRITHRETRAAHSEQSWAERNAKVDAKRRWEHRFCRTRCSTIVGVSCPARYEPHLERPDWAYAGYPSKDAYVKARKMAAEKAAEAAKEGKVATLSLAKDWPNEQPKRERGMVTMADALDAFRDGVSELGPDEMSESWSDEEPEGA